MILSAKPLNKSKEDPSYRRISSHYNDIVIYAYKKVLVRLMFYQASDESYGYIDIKNPHVYWWPSTLNKIGFKERKNLLISIVPCNFFLHRAGSSINHVATFLEILLPPL